MKGGLHFSYSWHGLLVYHNILWTRSSQSQIFSGTRWQVNISPKKFHFSNIKLLNEVVLGQVLVALSACCNGGYICTQYGQTIHCIMGGEWLIWKLLTRAYYQVKIYWYFGRGTCIPLICSFGALVIIDRDIILDRKASQQEVNFLDFRIKAVG